MGLESRSRETPTATLAELQAFRSETIELGLPSPATAELIRWDWLQREIDIFFTFEGTRLISLPGRRPPWPQSRQRIRLPILHSRMWCRVHLGYSLILESSSRSR
jgi:hypothetical protein